MTFLTYCSRRYLRKYSIVNQTMQTASIVSNIGLFWGSPLPSKTFTIYIITIVIIIVIRDDTSSPWDQAWCWEPFRWWRRWRTSWRWRTRCWLWWRTRGAPSGPRCTSGTFRNMEMEIRLPGSSHLPQQLSVNVSGASSCISTHSASISWLIQASCLSYLFD